MIIFNVIIFAILALFEETDIWKMFYIGMSVICFLTMSINHHIDSISRDNE